MVVLDRLYCNLSFPQEVLKTGGHFVIRYCTNTTFVADADRPAQESRDAQGRPIVQAWGWLGKVEKAEGDEKVSLVFSDDAFKKAFVVNTKTKKKIKTESN